MGPVPAAPEGGKARGLPSSDEHPLRLVADPGCGRDVQEGLKAYFKAKIEEAELAVRNKTQNLRRLEAQRNELNTKGTPATHGRAVGRASEQGRAPGAERNWGVDARVWALSLPGLCHLGWKAP